MNKIIIPYHLVIPAVISFGFLLIILIKRKQFFKTEMQKMLGISLTVFFAFYFYTVASAAFYELYYQWDFYKYDLNKDGLFFGNEITKEQQAAMTKLTNDGGRNIKFKTGLISSAIIAIIVFGIGRVYQLSKKK